jgi:flagellar hook-associated protein 3 FlgL
MRVTDRFIADSVINDLLRNKELLLRAQTTVSSQKKVNKPSDDPIGMAQILGYRKTISSVEQYQRNITQGKTQIEVVESVLDEIGSLLGEAKSIALDQSAGSVETRTTVTETVKNIYDQALQLANTRVGKSYVFSGHQTDTAPFSRDASYNATYHGDDGDVRMAIGENVNIKINTTGEDAFQGGANVFDVLRDLISGLENPDTDTGTSEIGAQLPLLEDALNQVTNVRATAASTFSRLETTENQLAQFKVKIEDMLSGTEDANIEKAVVELQAQETAYEASLATAAEVVQMSLMDYIG